MLRSKWVWGLHWRKKACTRWMSWSSGWRRIFVRMRATIRMVAWTLVSSIVWNLHLFANCPYHPNGSDIKSHETNSEVRQSIWLRIWLITFSRKKKNVFIEKKICMYWKLYCCELTCVLTKDCNKAIFSLFFLRKQTTFIPWYIHISNHILYVRTCMYVIELTMVLRGLSF